MTALPFTWDGETMTPSRGFSKRADAAFVVGETYRLEVVEDRSAASHRHYFVTIAEAWANLPEPLAERHPSPEHLRKFALIKAGFADSRQVVASSKAEAQRIAAFVKPMDDYAVVSVRDAVVTVWTAHSQSVKAMGKKQFQESKEATLRIVAEMIGVEPSTLAKEAGMAA